MHTVSINLIHGNPIRFRVELPEWQLLGLAADIEKAESRNVMALEVDGRLLMIPYSNIRFIHVDPVPPELPDYIVRGAKSF